MVVNQNETKQNAKNCTKLAKQIFTCSDVFKCLLLCSQQLTIL